MEELHIGQVTTSAQIDDEFEENDLFKVFCMACVRKHRDRDWGDVDHNKWIANQVAARLNNGPIESEWIIPKQFCIGWTDRIIINTNQDRTETLIKFPND